MQAASALCEQFEVVRPVLRGQRAYRTGSHEALLHQAGLPAYCLDLRNAPKSLAATLDHSRLQRSVGVIYCNTDADTVTTPMKVEYNTGHTWLCSTLLGLEAVQKGSAAVSIPVVFLEALVLPAKFLLVNPLPSSDDARGSSSLCFVTMLASAVHLLLLMQA